MTRTRTDHGTGGDPARGPVPPDRPSLRDRAPGLVGLLVLAGVLLGTRHTWGFDHLAYLPRWTAAIVVPFVAVVFLAGAPRRSGHGLPARLHHLLFHWRPGVVVWPALAGILFYLLRTRAHFLGDGYLLLDVLGSRHEPRPLESFGYIVLKQLRALFASAPDPSLAAYRAASIAAGMAGLLMVRRLAPRTGWEPARQLLFAGLYLAGGSTLLYCGYVENYAFLYAFLTAFVLGGAAAASGRAPLRLPALLLGAAAAAHLSAVLALPALAALALAGSAGSGRWKRLVAALSPTLVVIAALAAFLMLREGGAAALAAGLRDDANLGRPLRLLTGAHGLVSWRTPADVLNLLVLVAPVPMVLLLAARRGAPASAPGDPAVRFLAVLGGTLGAAMLLIDPKLGAARDWDLLAAHASALTALAVAVVPPAHLRPGRLTAAALACSLPWFMLSLDAPAAAGRLAVVARGFPPYAQSYAFEGLGMYYRDRGESAKAADMYRTATMILPGNARFHALLGAACVTLYNESDAQGAPQEAFMQQAEESYRLAQKINPNYPPVMDNLARLCVRKSGFAEAESLLTELARRQPLTVPQLQMLLFCQHRLGRFDRVEQTRRQILALDPQARIPAEWLAGPPAGK